MRRPFVTGERMNPLPVEENTSMARTTGYDMTNAAQIKAARKLAKSDKTYAQIAKALRLSSPKAAWCLVNNKAA